MVSGTGSSGSSRRAVTAPVTHGYAAAAQALGVPAARIVVLDTSVDTAQQAHAVREFLGTEARFVLVTAASHMPRSVRHFERAGFAPIAAPTHYGTGRDGHVLQGRYKAILVERESYLLELARYIVLNPVRAHLVDDPSEWEWSSYPATAGITNAPSWLMTDRILEGFGSDPRAAYWRFVQEGVGRASPWKELQAQLYLGSDAFVERQVSDRLGAMDPECPKAQQRPVPPSLDEFRSRYPRDEAIRRAHASGGYTLRAIGEYFGLHSSRASRIVSAGAEGKI